MHGRASLMELLVWLIPFLCVKRKRRERMKEKRREKMKGRMKEKMKRGMKRGDFFFKKNVSRPSNPPDEIAQNVLKKNPFQTNCSSFFCKSAESGRFFIYLHDSNSFFSGRGNLIRMGSSTSSQGWQHQCADLFFCCSLKRLCHGVRTRWCRHSAAGATAGGDTSG